MCAFHVIPGTLETEGSSKISGHSVAPKLQSLQSKSLTVSNYLRSLFPQGIDFLKSSLLNSPSCTIQGVLCFDERPMNFSTSTSEDLLLETISGDQGMVRNRPSCPQISRVGRIAETPLRIQE